MFCYAQLNENNICIGVSQLSGEVDASNMILLESYDVSLLCKKYNNGSWEEPEPTPPKPTEQEILQAEMLLNQTIILENQTAQDMVLAEILIGQTGGAVNV